MSETDRMLAINKKIKDLDLTESCKYILFQFSESEISLGLSRADVEIEAIQVGNVGVVVLDPCNGSWVQLTCDLLIDGEVAVENVFFEPMDVKTQDLPEYNNNTLFVGEKMGFFPVNCTLRFEIENGGMITSGTVLIVLNFNKLSDLEQIPVMRNI